jgi:Cu2+-exporting ATPase
VALGIGAAFAASVFATLSGAGAVYFDSITMFIFLLLGARYLEMSARMRAALQQEQLAHSVPAVAERFVSWPASDLAELVAAARLREGDHFARTRGRGRARRRCSRGGCKRSRRTTVDRRSPCRG